MDILTIAQPMVGVELSQVLGRQIESCDNCPSTERIGIGKNVRGRSRPFYDLWATLQGFPVPFQEHGISDAIKKNPGTHTPVKICKVHILRILYCHLEEVLQTQLVRHPLQSVGSQHGFTQARAAHDCKYWTAEARLSVVASHKLLAEALLQQNGLQRYSAMVDFELESSNLASSSPASTGPNVFIGNIADSSALDSACTASRIAWS